MCGGQCWPEAGWTPAPSPAALGWSRTGLANAKACSHEIGSDAVMIVDRGLVVAEGAIDLSLTLADLGLDDVPPSLTDTEKQATLEELLQARSGVYHEAAAES